MADSRLRRERLLSLLPRVFVGQPDSSAIGTLIQAMAAVLSDLDSAVERTLRDRWVNLASGLPPSRTEESALELLGRLLDIRRLRWHVAGETGEVVDSEEAEVFRQRLLLTAGIMTHGLTTPRALLALAVTTLGAELCSQVQSSKDATIGWGMPLGTRRRCPVCQGNQVGNCPYADRRVMDAWITDNPPLRQRIERVFTPTLDETSCAVDFTVTNPSLAPDVPAFTLQPLVESVCYPALQNHATHEICLFAGELQPGETLSVWPEIQLAEWQCFDSYDAADHHSWRYQYPRGSAVILDRQGRLRDVSQAMYYVRGSGFNDSASRFAGLMDDAPECARFGASTQQVRTPWLRPHEDRWLYRLFTRYDIDAFLGQEAGDRLVSAPEKATPARVKLIVKWWQRPPATFRLRAPRNAWVRTAEGRGALALLKDHMERARAAGVRALLDFPEPVYRETQVFSSTHDIQVIAHIKDSASLREGDLHIQMDRSLEENHPLDDICSWLGVFDVTRLDWSHLG